ncbi:MAG: type II toxin-antitoxin system VapC family toxin [Thermomicrobiales bacterium]|jgi:predicted nucleic acid-binding protein|nr:type II toxin-antitoxin system VapC family toxin [Thermomicrobiales bacterium]
MILVDTNVLLDVVTDDPRWAGWSQAQLDAASLADRMVINPVIYSELSIAFSRIEELEAVLTEAGVTVEEIPREALFLAGKVFVDYRRRQGTKQGVLPDFHVGAHAAVMRWPILTRDVSRYRSHFPTVALITPQ